jgi:hypothetical protein
MSWLFQFGLGPSTRLFWLGWTSTHIEVSFTSIKLLSTMLLLAVAQVFTTHVLHAQSLFLIAACRIQFHQISHPWSIKRTSKNSPYSSCTFSSTNYITPILQRVSISFKMIIVCPSVFLAIKFARICLS